jgi:hypothetical protein
MDVRYALSKDIGQATKYPPYFVSFYVGFFSYVDVIQFSQVQNPPE